MIFLFILMIRKAIIFYQTDYLSSVLDEVDQELFFSFLGLPIRYQSNILNFYLGIDNLLNCLNDLLLYKVFDRILWFRGNLFMSKTFFGVIFSINLMKS